MLDQDAWPADPAQPRRSYRSSELTESGLAADWLSQLRRWYDEAAADPRITEPNAMQVATVDGDGRPDVRTVLARGFDEAGIVFYTNYESAKGAQLSANPSVALLFSWLPLERQVRLRGTAARVDRPTTEAYFAGRPRGSQLGAWASPQSEVIASREVLLEREVSFAQRFEGGPVPAPPNWGGFRATVSSVEFWQGRESRLHDRLRFSRTSGGRWVLERLAP